MPSLLHEGLINLIRDQPQLTASLLDLLRVDVPRLGDARLAEAALNDLSPVEYYADAVVLFGEPKPVYGVIIEAQLKPDERKRFTWPVYVTTARSRHECPFVLIVVTLSAAMERWSAQPIRIGGTMVHEPYVVGPSGVPKITDLARASREPQLALLSLILHGRGDVDVAVAITMAVTAAIERFPDELRLVYSALIESALSPDAREALKMEPQVIRMLSESQRKSFAEGEAKGEAKAVLKILAQRGLVITDLQRARISDCSDLEVLDQWMDRAFAVRAVDELFA